MKVFLSAWAAAIAAMVSVASAAPTIVADFEAGVVGDDVSTLGWSVDTSGSLTFTVQNDPAGGANKVLRSQGTPGTTGLAAYVALPAVVPDSSTAATLFYQLRLDGGSATDRTLAGFTGSSTTPASFDDMSAYAGARTGGGAFGYRDGGTSVNPASPSALDDVWYNLWIVINNDADTYDVWISSGTNGAATQLANNAAFRTGGPNGDQLGVGVVGTGAQGETGAVYFDNFILDTSGENLDYLLGVPEPATAGLLAIGLLLMGARRRSA